MSPKFNDFCPEKKRSGHAETERQMPCEAGDKDRSGAATSQGMPQIASYLQGLGEAQNRLSLGTSKKNQPYQHLDFRFWSPELLKL